VSLYTDDYAPSPLNFDINTTAAETLISVGPARLGVIAYQLSESGGSINKSHDGFTTGARSRSAAVERK
jgi:hypothetical protein